MINGYRYCSLSKERLQKPIVGDSYGKLYNKERVLEYLLNRKRHQPQNNDDDKDSQSCTIRSLNDVVNLNILLIEDTLKCPISDITVDLKSDDDNKNNIQNIQFSYIVPCGCVMNKLILDKLETTKCPNCGEVFSMENVIDINPQDEEIRHLQRRRISKLKKLGQYHNLKYRTKKNKK